MFTGKKGLFILFMDVLVLILGWVMVQEGEMLLNVIGVLICLAELLQIGTVILFKLSLIRNIIMGEQLWHIVNMVEICCFITVLWLTGPYLILNFLVSILVAGSLYRYVRKYQYFYKKPSVKKVPYF